MKAQTRCKAEILQKLQLFWVEKLILSQNGKTSQRKKNSNTTSIARRQMLMLYVAFKTLFHAVLVVITSTNNIYSMFSASNQHKKIADIIQPGQRIKHTILKSEKNQSSQTFKKWLIRKTKRTLAKMPSYHVQLTPILTQQSHVFDQDMAFC